MLTSNSENRRAPGIIYWAVTMLLRTALVLALFGAGWLIYQNLPNDVTTSPAERPGGATIQLIIQPSPDMAGVALDIPVELWAVDIVSVHHEYLIERRAGKRLDDFMKERMNGRQTISARLDPQGQGVVVLTPGKWWVHASLAGDHDLEWRLPITVSASTSKQTVVLTPQNAYTRAKSF
jgi:hypothetical protein